MTALDRKFLHSGVSLQFTASTYTDRLSTDDDDDDNGSAGDRCGSAKSSGTSSSSSRLSGDDQPSQTSSSSSANSGYQSDKNPEISGISTKQDVVKLFEVRSPSSSSGADPISPSPPVRKTFELDHLFTASSLKQKSNEATSEDTQINDDLTLEPYTGGSRRKKSINTQVKAKVSEVSSRMGRIRSKIRRQVSAKKVHQTNDGSSSDLQRGDEDPEQLSPDGATSKDIGILQDSVRESSGNDKETSIGEIDEDCLVKPFIECHDNEIEED